MITLMWMASFQKRTHLEPTDECVIQKTTRRDNWSVHVDTPLSCYPSTGRSCPALLLQAPGQGLELPPPHDIVTQTSPLHVGVAESVQSADADYVVTTAAVATMVLPVKGMV